MLPDMTISPVGIDFINTDVYTIRHDVIKHRLTTQSFDRMKKYRYEVNREDFKSVFSAARRRRSQLQRLAFKSKANLTSTVNVTQLPK